MMNIKLALTLLLLYVSMPFAQAQNGFYIGGGFGISDVKSPEDLQDLCNGFGIDCSTSDSDTMIKGIIGYRVNDYFAVEGTLFDVGEPSIGADVLIPISATVELSGGSISLIPQIPLGNNGFLFGRIGATAAEAKLTASAPTLGLSESDSTSAAGLIYGFGGGFNVGRNVTLVLEWERYSFDEVLALSDSSIDAPEIDVFAGSIIYRFSNQ